MHSTLKITTALLTYMYNYKRKPIAIKKAVVHIYYLPFLPQFVSVFQIVFNVRLQRERERERRGREGGREGEIDSC